MKGPRLDKCFQETLRTFGLKTEEKAAQRGPRATLNICLTVLNPDFGGVIQKFGHTLPRLLGVIRK